MSGRKHRPVLYEVVRRSRLNAGNEARRMVTPAPVAPPGPPVAEDDGFELRAAEPALAVAAPLRDPRPAPAAGGGLPAWTAWLSEGRLHLSVGWVGASIVAVAVILVLFVTFQAGMRFASPAPPAARDTPAKPADTTGPRSPERQSNPQAPADLSVFTPARNAPATPGSTAVPPEPAPRSTPPAAPAAAPPPTSAQPAAAAVRSDDFDFESGSYYLVIQHFHRDQGEAAQQAQEFLKASGVDCVVRVGSKDIRLFATRAFRLSGGDATGRKAERAALDDLKRRVKELGKEYTRTRAKGYAFDQCYELKQ